MFSSPTRQLNKFVLAGSFTNEYAFSTEIIILISWHLLYARTIGLTVT